jgi:hypothetical protein
VHLAPNAEMANDVSSDSTLEQDEKETHYLYIQSTVNWREGHKLFGKRV